MYNGLLISRCIDIFTFIISSTYIYTHIYIYIEREILNSIIVLS